MALTNEDRRRGQEKSAQVKTRKRLELAERRQTVDTLTEWADREQLPNTALRTVLTIMGAVEQGIGNLPEVTSALDVQRLAEAAKTVHSLFRLEMGESTANTVSVQVSKDELEARLAKLREQDAQAG